MKKHGGELPGPRCTNSHRSKVNGNSTVERGRRKATSQASRRERKAVVTGPPFHLYTARKKGEQGHDDNRTTFQEAFTGSSELFRGRRHVLVLAGAGISVSCGIPDFRSKGTGLYSTLDAEAIGLTSNDPQELFDLEIFKENPRPFYLFAKNLYPGSVTPSVSHCFLALLHQLGMLLRVYTQNIDGLEEIAGVPKSKVVHAHGSLSWAQCMRCRAKMDSSEIAEDVKQGTVPRCDRPRKNGCGELKRKTSVASSVDSSEQQSGEKNSSQRSRRKTSRFMESGLLGSHQSGDSDHCDVGRSSLDTVEESNDMTICGGVIKPGITFFGEKLDDRVRRRLEADREKADCLVVIGTSLSVAPMSKVIRYLKPSIPRILINRNLVKVPNHTLGDDDDGGEDMDFREGYAFDACLLGFCDDVTRALASKISSWGPLKNGGNERKSVDSIVQKGEVLCNKEEEYSGPNGTIRGLHNHPTERVLLFPGAVLDKCDSDSDISYEEVAHCDGCQGQIHGPIMKCVDCFDYDLCMKCFPRISEKHYDGKHKFIRE